MGVGVADAMKARDFVHVLEKAPKLTSQALRTQLEEHRAQWEHARLQIK